MSITLKTRDASAFGKKFVHLHIESATHDLGLLDEQGLAELAGSLREAAEDMHPLDVAQTEAYAEGRKDERDDFSIVLDELQSYLEAQDALDNREYNGINAEDYFVLLRRRNNARNSLDAALSKVGEQ